VTTARIRIRHLGRMTREHALILTCACAAILLFNLPPADMHWATFGASSEKLRSEIDTDQALQEAASAALDGRQGAIIVMDPQSGRVRAAVNPELLFNQPLMPGSTMKPFTTLAALRAGLISPDSRTVCPGRFTGLSFSLPCVHDDHLPPFTPSQAIAYSCNYYFATLGQRLGRDKLIETVRSLGFGQPNGSPEGQEVAGTLRPCRTGTSTRVRTESNHASEQRDCDAREAVGESNQIMVTPVQLLAAYAALVNGGHLFQVRSAEPDEFQAVERSRINISEQHRAVIIEGMRGAVRYGTARRARLDSLPLYIIGKTGTALPAKGFRFNGWFVGFAGSDANPVSSAGEMKPDEVKLAVLVLVGRSHGSDAAALSKPIFEAYANALSRSETQRPKSSDEKIGMDGTKSFASPRLPSSASTVHVHLVRDNITQEIALEDYVLGVLRTEGSMETQSEALKALAIAIRTYALRNRARHAKDGYDFCSTTHCQRFAATGGGSSVNAGVSDRLAGAVRATEGQVLLDNQGQTADVYFGASCGGETANLGTLWGTSPPEYLRGVRDEYCVSGPHATWTDVITRADLLRALQSDARTDVGSRVDQVAVNKRDETGRAEFITLEGEHRKTVRGWDFKIIVGRVLGWNILKSSRFDITRSGSNFIFHGRGFGHGLGLCQEGAHVMALRGTSYTRILEKYFPGTSVRKDAETRGRGDRVSLNPTSRWSADILLFADKNLPVSPSPRPRVLVLSSEHFRVTYPANVARRDADQVLNTLEAARADFLRRASAVLGPVNIPFLEIRLNESTGDFTSRTGQPWWAAAATKGNRIELQPAGLLKRRGLLTNTLRHELAHTVINSASRNRAPRWLEEGFALYLAGEGRTISRYLTRSAHSTEELEKRLTRPGSQEAMRSLYAEAYTRVFELIRSNGEASIWKKLAES
jgi:stage II sporulation protein D